MDWLQSNALGLLGVVVGAAAAWFGLKARVDRALAEVESVQTALASHLEENKDATIRLVVVEEQSKQAILQRGEIFAALAMLGDRLEATFSKRLDATDAEIVRIRDRQHDMANVLTTIQLSRERSGG